MKKLLTFFMMSILAIGIGWADETVFYTLTPTNGSNNSYAGNCDIVIDGITWNLTGNSTMNPWRIGGKNLTKVDRDLYSKTAMGSAISRIEVEIGSITCTAHSAKLTVASDANFSTVLDEVTLSTVSANSTLEFAPSSGTEWATGAYYKFTFNVTCGSSNSYVGFAGATFYAEESTPSAVSTPVISGTTPFEESTEVTITCETTGADIYYTLDGSEPTTSSIQYSAPFTITETTTVKAIAALDGETSNVATKTFTAIPTIASVAEFNALDLNANFKYTASNLVAIVANSSNLYVQDGEKGMLIYGSTGQSYQLGDVIPGGFTGTRATYNGAPEMTNPAGFAASEDNVEVTPMEITPSQVNMENFARYVIIKNAAFNTTAKTITASGETIAYHTTFNNNIPTDGAAYDVIGVCGYYNNNPQFLPISFTEAVTTGPDYYLIGSFNGWTQKDENYKFTALADGSYTLNGTMADDVLFKVLKVEGENITWLGGSAGDYFAITKDVCTDIPLVDGANFKLEVGGICTFTVSADQKLSVSKEAQLFLVGTMNDWEKTSALEATEDGWTIETALYADDEFKFVDEWGSWYGGGNTIAEANLGAQITLNNGGNFVMAVDGDFIINVAADKSSFVITRKAETTEAMFNFNDDYLTLFPFLEDETLPYNIQQAITATVDGISVTISPKTGSGTDNRIWTGNPRLRVYSGTITVTASEGYNLTGIEFSNHSSNFNLTPSDGEMGGSGSARTWTGEVPTLVLTVNSNTQINTMNVTIAKANANAPAAPVIEGETPFVGSTEVTITCATEGASIYYTTDGSDPTTESTLYEAPFTINQAVTVKARAYSEGGVASTITSKEFVKTPEVASATAFYNYEGTDEFVFTGNLVAIAQTGNYLYAQDDAKGVLIYGTIDQTYAKGDKIPAGFHAKKGAYHGAPQMTNATGMQAATEQATIEPVELTIPQITLDNYSRYAVIKEVEYKDGKIIAGTDTLAIFNRFNVETTPVDGQIYNVIGVAGWHDGAQFMPLEYVEVNHTYTIAGTPAALFGSENAWDIENENGLMTLDDDIYTWTSEPTELEGSLEFRIVKDNSWDVAYPSGNYVINNIKPGTYTLTVTLDPATGEVNATLDGQVDVYVFGEINGNDFTPNEGVKMNTEDGKIYTATVNITDTENGYSFFAFTNKLGADANDWSTVNAYRFMAQSNGNFLVNGATMNVELNMAYNGDNSMQIPVGEYTLTVDMENMKLTIVGGTQLSYILADGYEGIDYTIINDLYIVDKAEMTGQFFVSDGNDNWVAINAGDFFNGDMVSLKGGFVSGTIAGKNLNPYFTLSAAPVEGEDVEPVEPAVYSLANPFSPKVNEVVIVSKAYYKASEGNLRAYAPGGHQGQSLTVDTSFGDFEFVDGQRYTVQGVINIKESWNDRAGMKDYDYPFQNYTIKPTSVTEESTPTAINGIFLEEGVKSVRFYNAAGVESNVPFQGVNIVVKEMNDGSKVTTKVIVK
ncbi:MAG: chitobiase/beta-hexosaminidase C-terminal domain-containing protein [Muribaculaceae bacterium]|nr:chitobiase/beta-hexosaminidase C-terminal domain-containing protein [Muribaculaceae bacterium]